MEEYLKEWLMVIESMRNENTYKLAWGRALLHCVTMSHQQSEDIIIPFSDVAELMLEYYWNQLFYFKLKQGPNKTPLLVTITESLIQDYKYSTLSNLPKWYREAEKTLFPTPETKQLCLREISFVLTKDVSWRFLHSNGKVVNLYQIDLKLQIVKFTSQQVEVLKIYSYILSQLLNYRWAQLLEQFNNSPKIVSKVKGLSINAINRQSLIKYRELLLELHHGAALDFYTEEIIPDGEISVDHVIPWSFIYSDDIWNLVLTNKSYNSTKNNNIPSDFFIDKLKKRNEEWYQKTKNPHVKKQLFNALNDKLVDRYYYELKSN